MQFDYSRLRGRIVEKYGSCAAFGRAIGRTKSIISEKLSNKVRITSDEIIDWSAPDKLDIPAEEIPAYFLVPKV